MYVDVLNLRFIRTVLFTEIMLGIRMFLGLQDPDPDPLFRGADTDPSPEPSLF
jgi:hypothetical protein